MDIYDPDVNKALLYLRSNGGKGDLCDILAPERAVEIARFLQSEGLVVPRGSR
ncbi:MAG: hypothetical protein Q4Q58_06225 [Thermoplasmata archaeon]|nr:hypothetical protein [Thermoplasmata archaeon]